MCSSAGTHCATPLAPELPAAALHIIFTFVLQQSQTPFTDGSCPVATLCAGCCVSRGWRDAVLAPSLWRRLVLTSGLRAGRGPWLTDARLLSLVSRSQGTLECLDVSGCLWPSLSVDGIVAALAGMEGRVALLSVEGVPADTFPPINRLRGYVSADGQLDVGHDATVGTCLGKGPSNAADPGSCGRLCRVSNACDDCGESWCGSCLALLRLADGSLYCGAEPCDCSCRSCFAVISEAIAASKPSVPLSEQPAAPAGDVSPGRTPDPANGVAAAGDAAAVVAGAPELLAMGAGAGPDTAAADADTPWCHAKRSSARALLVSWEARMASPWAALRDIEVGCTSCGRAFCPLCHKFGDQPGEPCDGCALCEDTYCKGCVDAMFGRCDGCLAFICAGHAEAGELRDCDGCSELLCSSCWPVGKAETLDAGRCSDCARVLCASCAPSGLVACDGCASLVCSSCWSDGDGGPRPRLSCAECRATACSRWCSEQLLHPCGGLEAGCEEGACLVPPGDDSRPRFCGEACGLAWHRTRPGGCARRGQSPLLRL